MSKDTPDIQKVKKWYMDCCNANENEFMEFYNVVKELCKKGYSINDALIFTFLYKDITDRIEGIFKEYELKTKD